MFGIKNRREVKAEIPKDTISSIPYDAAYINGIIKVRSGKFSKSYLLPEINYVSTNEEKQWNIAEEYAKFIGSFDPSARVFVTLYNRNDNGNEFVENIHITMKGDGLDEYRDEYNKIIEDKIKLANNNISMQAILTISLDAIDIFEADKKFSNQIDKLVSDYLTLITDETLLPVPIEERLDILNSIYNMENYTPLTEKKVVDGKLVETFSLQNCANQGISTKNAIAPAFMDVTDKRIRFNESTFCKTYMVRTFPSYLKGNVLTDFCSIPTSMLVTTVYDVKDTTEGIDEVKTNDPDKQWILSMILVPLALDGVINIAFMGLTYYIRLSDNDTYRLVLVFDNTLTQIFGIEGEDIAGIKASIEAEFLREERRLDDEIYEAQLEYEKLARYNPFADSVINDYVENTEGNENKEGGHEKCRR